MTFGKVYIAMVLTLWFFGIVKTIKDADRGEDVPLGCFMYLISGIICAVPMTAIIYLWVWAVTP